MNDHDSFDVIVLGAAFGGSLLSSILSREGMSVALVERNRHPRFAIGESSTPAADLLLKELANRYNLSELQPLVRFGSWRDAYPHLNCGCKRGFSYFSHTAPGGFQSRTDHRHELLVAASASRAMADTQWYRPDLDHYLATIAKSYCVNYFEAAEVSDIEHSRPGAWTITIIHDGRQKRLHANFLIDASGPAGVLMQQLLIADATDLLQTRSAAVYGHWNQVRPLEEWLTSREVIVKDYPFPCQDSAVHHLFDDGWLWQLRFENGLTSLGYVFTADEADRSNLSAAELWSALLIKQPVLSEILGQPQLADFPGRLYRTGRLQRLFSAGAGDDWAALPSTVGFIDPLHSTGIAHTLSGVERLSRIILTTSSDDRPQALEDYSRCLVDELLHIDRLVAGCYDGLRDFRLFTAWSMLYFAAATTFERRWMANTGARPVFLCADDEDFVQCVSDLHEVLRSLCETSACLDEARVDAFCERVRETIRPYNHVGLFEAAIPNMYYHTYADK